MDVVSWLAYGSLAPIKLPPRRRWFSGEGDFFIW